jgi:hypothetical protein
MACTATCSPLASAPRTKSRSLWLVEERREHLRRRGAQRSVGESLHAADADEVAAQGRLDAQVGELLVFGERLEESDAHRQLALLRELLVAPQEPLARLRGHAGHVVHRDDAVLAQLQKRSSDALRDLVLRRLRHRRFHQHHGVVAQDAARRARAGQAVDGAARRIGRVAADARQHERARVGDAHVPVVASKPDRPVAHEAIDQLRGRQLAAQGAVVVPVAAQHPAILGQLPVEIL